jgi:hypothetical protein
MEILDPIEEQYNRIQASKSKTTQITKKAKIDFNVKNYLNVRLGKGENEKKLHIRILMLTSDSLTPFKEVHTHYLKSAKSSYICTKQTEGLPEGTNKNCPFCDIREGAAQEQKKGGETFDKYKDIYKNNCPSKYYIVRVIDRSDEDFGIKFWRMSQSNYESIIDIYKNNKEEGVDIFDTKKGRDLIVTVKKQEKKGVICSIITSILSSSKESQLASTDERIDELIKDKKVWNDVFGIKSFEYLQIKINGGDPFFDQKLGKYVDKKEFSNSNELDDETEIEDESDTTNENKNTANDTEETDDLPF